MTNKASASGASMTRGFTAALAATAIILVALFGTTTEAAQKQDAADNTGGLGFEAQTSAVFANSMNNANVAVFNAKEVGIVEVGINGLIANEHVSTVQVVRTENNDMMTWAGVGNQVFTVGTAGNNGRENNNWITFTNTGGQNNTGANTHTTQTTGDFHDTSQVFVNRLTQFDGASQVHIGS